MRIKNIFYNLGGKNGNEFKKTVCVSMAAVSAVSGIASYAASYADAASEKGVEEYRVPVMLKNANEDKPSMGNKALE